MYDDGDDEEAYDEAEIAVEIGDDDWTLLKGAGPSLHLLVDLDVD
jgi:hypothetical protein